MATLAELAARGYVASPGVGGDAGTRTALSAPTMFPKELDPYNIFGASEYTPELAQWWNSKTEAQRQDMTNFIRGARGDFVAPTGTASPIGYQTLYRPNDQPLPQELLNKQIEDQFGQQSAWVTAGRPLAKIVGSVIAGNAIGGALGGAGEAGAEAGAAGGEAGTGLGTSASTAATGVAPAATQGLVGGIGGVDAGLLAGGGGAGGSIGSGALQGSGVGTGINAATGATEIGGSAAAAGTPLSRILNGTATTADYLSVGGNAGSSLLGVLGSRNQANAYGNLTNQYMGMGAPSRARYEASMTPGFDPMSIPGYSGAIDTASKGLLARLAATGGNPYGNPGGLIEANKQIIAGTALPAIQQYQNQNASTGGYNAFNTAAPAAANAGIGATGNIYNAVGSGLAGLLNPQPSILETLRGLGVQGLS